jgi:hypothetical protein
MSTGVPPIRRPLEAKQAQHVLRCMSPERPGPAIGGTLLGASGVELTSDEHPVRYAGQPTPDAVEKGFSGR